MMATTYSNPMGVTFQHRQVTVDDVQLHTVSIGQADKPAVLCLHGFPQNWFAFRQIMAGLQDSYYAVAIDLPGVGQSGKIAANDTQTIARYVNGIVKALDLHDVTLVGHDMGGMVTYAYLHAYPDQLKKAVIMNVAVPGIDPWSQVEQNPHIWHFAFHAVPDLPETLVTGKERVYFDYFFNAIATHPDRIDEQARETYVAAYSTPDALHTGFEWYRAFPQDVKQNTDLMGSSVQTPVLYLRGDGEYGSMDDYLNGFREGGLVDIQGQLIPDSGHYAPDEAPPAVVNLLKAFIQ